MPSPTNLNRAKRNLNSGLRYCVDRGRVHQCSPACILNADFRAAVAGATQPSEEVSDGIHRERSIEPGFQHFDVDDCLPAAAGTFH